MDTRAHSAQIVILNGAPRSGKSSIAKAMQASASEPWINLGVDAYYEMTPERLRPGIGLRPGGERPDIEDVLPYLYAALYESVAAHAGLGLNVVVDIGHHDHYSQPLGILRDSLRRLEGFPVLLIGVRCPLDEVMQRRAIPQPGREELYHVGGDASTIPEPVRLWQEAVHIPGVYDLEVDTSRLTPDECAALIAERLQRGIPSPSAAERIAASKSSL
ncbi:chloramphenicol phosphotransferase CPT family protein [Oryzifoliimicrobium ureilyticus]|uniref:chloramphenicol phosphotransferase CPT family protein n=1 Tax=Oryzifoliimicrobium ureilyticus TaxID=3113724 RepID=UPI0030763029